MVVKQKTKQFTEKISLYVTKEVADIYRQGKYNQWDVADLGRKGFSDSLIKNRDTLLKPAGPEADSE